MQSHTVSSSAMSLPSCNKTALARKVRKSIATLAVIFVVLSVLQTRLTAQIDPNAGYQPYNQAYAPSQQAQSLTPDQLEQLVAPIALNPDPLVALMLAASTYPQQVTDADHWRQAQGNAPPDQIAYGADTQNWDPSVKALTAFPQVLAEMDQNIQWTAALGNAYYNQPQDILQAIQIMRQRAQAAGNLQSTPQEAVSYNQGSIQLMPANPQVIYVPAYNPWTVYGQPVAPYPGFSLFSAIGSFFSSALGYSSYGGGYGSSAVRFGLGIVMSAFNHSPWGLISWGLDWLTHNLLFHQSNYYSNSITVADWGLRYGGPRARYAPHGEYAGYNWYHHSGSNNWSRTGYGNSVSYGSNYRSSVYSRPQSPFAARGNSYYNSNYSRAGFNTSYRSGIANSMAGRTQSPFANHGYPANNMRAAYRSPMQGSTHDSYGQRSNSFVRSSAFTNSSSRQGNGFHLFGSGHSNSNSFGSSHSFGHEGSFKMPKTPKAPKAPKGFGGGSHHSFGGGHNSHSGRGHHH